MTQNHHTQIRSLEPLNAYTVNKRLSQLDSAISNVSTDLTQLEGVTVLGSNQASVTLSSISADYNHLLLLFEGDDTTIFGRFAVQFNGDTTSGNYTTYLLRYSGDPLTRTVVETVSSDFIYSPANPNDVIPSVTMIYIPGYRSTNKFQQVYCYGTRNSSSALGIMHTCGIWLSTAAVTSITVSSVNGNVGAGSRYALYGLDPA